MLARYSCHLVIIFVRSLVVLAAMSAFSVAAEAIKAKAKAAGDAQNAVSKKAACTNIVQQSVAIIGWAGESRSSNAGFRRGHNFTGHSTFIRH